MLPLPEGEGRGEGEQSVRIPERCDFSNRLTKFEKSCICCAVRVSEFFRDSVFEFRILGGTTLALVFEHDALDHFIYLAVVNRADTLG